MCVPAAGPVKQRRASTLAVVFEELLAEWDGEQAVIRFDRPSGAWMFICIHSTKRGPAGGGTRMRVYPTPGEGLRDGMRLALLTGNPEPVARARMERLGLARFFPPGQGGFGCDAEERAALIETARRRAGGWPAGRTVAVGDTPRDGEAAREAGIRSILFGPDVEDMAGVVAALRPLA